MMMKKHVMRIMRMININKDKSEDDHKFNHDDIYTDDHEERCEDDSDVHHK